MAKIYIASSWKNQGEVEALAMFLRAEGHEVDAFTDTSLGRYVFHWSEMKKGKESWEAFAQRIDAKSFLKDKRTRRAFKEDKKWLDWADTVILILPAGNSAHLEAGYAKGHGKRLFIFAPKGFPKGEFDVMYGFADSLLDNATELLKVVEK